MEILKKCRKDGSKQNKERKEIPSDGNESIILLLYKKGDKADLTNFRLVMLFNIIYKFLTKIPINRLTKKFDEYQSKEQMGNRSALVIIY